MKFNTLIGTKWHYFDDTYVLPQNDFVLRRYVGSACLTPENSLDTKRSTVFFFVGDTQGPTQSLEVSLTHEENMHTHTDTKYECPSNTTH